MRSPTAWMMIAQRLLEGMKKNTDVKAYSARRTITAVKIPARGVLTPAFALMAVLEKEPVAGYPPRKGPKTLVKPRATSSCEGSMM